MTAQAFLTMVYWIMDMNPKVTWKNTFLYRRKSLKTCIKKVVSVFKAVYTCHDISGCTDDVDSNKLALVGTEEYLMRGIIWKIQSHCKRDLARGDGIALPILAAALDPPCCLSLLCRALLFPTSCTPAAATSSLS